MHAYNAWLPPPVRELLEADPEKDKFHKVVLEVERYWKLGSAEARYSSLKWIPVVNTFLKARSEIASSDVELLVKRGLDIILCSGDNLFTQIRWGQCIGKILKKYRNHLQLDVEWRPLYKLLYEIHFKRRNSYEGLALKQHHLDTVCTLIRCARNFFPEGSAAEIWTKFRPALDDLTHNSSLEALGFISLFLPTKLNKLSEADRSLLSREWVEDCFNRWAALPNSHYWDRQWASILCRYIKHCYISNPIDWDPFLHILFTHCLRSFEVPVGKSGTSSPVRRDISREVVLAFNGGGWTVSVSKYFAKAIIYLLKPGGKADSYLRNLIDLLEQLRLSARCALLLTDLRMYWKYYHPSNGGPWTISLERFLYHLVAYFQKRLAFEQRTRLTAQAGDLKCLLGQPERVSFVKIVLPLIERGQYSKDGYLSGTAASTASMLSFVEPSLVLPLINARFHTALSTITATHQLESAVTTLALAARPAFLACAKDGVFKKQDSSHPISSAYLEDFTETLVAAMFNTLLGMDANDPPKTLATMELFSSILCNVGIVGDIADGGSLALPIDWSQWLDEFLSRLFMLLIHLEPSGQPIDTALDDGYELASSTFLMQGGSFYHSVIELLFGRLTKPLHLQALKKLAQFVHNNALPGAAPEIGLLCSFAVLTDPADAITLLLRPLMNSLVSSLSEFPSTGFGGSGTETTNSKITLSQAVETSVTFQLNILSASIMFGGADLLRVKDLLQAVIAAAFNAPSTKVNEAGNRLLNSLLGSLIFYYPVDQYKLNTESEDGVEGWISTKLSPNSNDCPKWHIPNTEEVAYAEELLNEHLRGPLESLRRICQDNLAEHAGRDFLRVAFLRLDASIRGVGSCLPDFQVPSQLKSTDSSFKRPLKVAGSFGARVGNVKLREDTADTLHLAFEYLFKEKADDTVLLMMLIRVMDLLGNCATMEYSFWENGRHLRRAETKCLTEPKMNFITNPDAKSKRRPRWLVVDMVFLHNAWRSSQECYRPISPGDGSIPVPPHVALLAMDLLKLSLHRYDIVRKFSGSALSKTLKRFPALVKACLPSLIKSLEDPEAIEDSALGACKILTLRPVLRHLTQDVEALSLFFRSLLKSAHHESVKAQSAINELFVVFSVRFGGLPAFSSSRRSTDGSTYTDLLSYVKGVSSDTAVSVHWRYNLMANGMLLLLLVPPFGKDSSKPKSEILKSRRIVAVQFLSNLKSDLPALRPLSVIGLLCLLRASLNKIPVNTKSPESLKAKGEEAALSLEATLSPVFQEPGFCSSVIQNIAFDHHYPEGQGRAGRFLGGRGGRISDLGLTALMPAFTRDWPRTRTWDSVSVGEAFASGNAKLFKRLIQECGAVVLDAFRLPLEETVDSTERGKQCVAAEIMAGFLHSDVGCVTEAWSGWLCPLLRKALTQATVESVTEWGACIRFAVTGKGHNGEDVPLLRFEVLECLAEPLSSTASTSLVAKRLTLLRAALVELGPVSNSSKEALLFASLLNEVTASMTHPAPQVRENVGSLMCILLGNLLCPSVCSRHDSSQTADHAEDESVGLSPDLTMFGHGPEIPIQRPEVAVERPQVSVRSHGNASNNEAGQTLIQAANQIKSGESPPSDFPDKDGRKCTSTATVEQYTQALIEEAKIAAMRIQSLGGPNFGGSSSIATSSNLTEDLTMSNNQDARWIETLFHFIIASIKSGKAVDMTGTLVGLLNPLLSLQETPIKELSGLAKISLRLMNWHPFPVKYLPNAVTAVLDAAASSNWHTRVAALVYIQSFVYRHIFILGMEDEKLLWTRVQELLSDPQVEVRELAAMTLAGLMKDSNSSFATAFRDHALQGASTLHGTGRLKKRAKASVPPPNGATAAVHGHVLGLAACVLSVPYDMPSWLPDMVTLLGRFVGEPTPIRSTVKKTIAEFRRTHSDTWAYQKDSFSKEQMEVLSDLTTSASYFA